MFPIHGKCSFDVISVSCLLRETRACTELEKANEVFNIPYYRAGPARRSKGRCIALRLVTPLR